MRQASLLVLAAATLQEPQLRSASAPGLSTLTARLAALRAKIGAAPAPAPMPSLLQEVDLAGLHRVRGRVQALHAKIAASATPNKGEAGLQSELDALHSLSGRLQSEAATHANPIPGQLFLTSNYSSVDDLPAALKENVQHIIALNPGFDIVWADDAACEAFLKEDTSVVNAAGKPTLAALFSRVTDGSYRSDICRTAWLAKNGGWYVDLDVDLRAPLGEVANTQTTFVSTYDSEDGAGVKNVIVGSRPASPILAAAVQYLASDAGQEGCNKLDAVSCGYANWSCRPKPGRGCGARAMQEGLQQFLAKSKYTLPDKFPAGSLRLLDEEVRLLKEVDLAAPQTWLESESDFAKDAIKHRGVSNFAKMLGGEKHFKGLDYALLQREPGGTALVGYSRYAGCDDWGCASVPHDKLKKAQPKLENTTDPKKPSLLQWAATSAGAFR